jgi:toxin ParE1/3/4
MTAAFAPQARRDLMDTLRWIARDDPRAAAAFRDAVLAAAARIGEHSRIGTERPNLAPAPVRFLAMTGFPHVIVYDADLRPPLVLRVLHGARDLPELLGDL